LGETGKGVKQNYKMNISPIKSEWLVIVNPNAGKGRGRKDWKVISAYLSKPGLLFSEKFTERKEHAIAITNEAITSGYRKILCVGGDGTLNEIVNGVFNQNICPTQDITLGLIPIGTGNDWGRMFGIPLNYEGASQIIKEGKTTIHDIGKVTYYTGPEKRTRYFINIAGLGFESEVVKRTNIQKDNGKGGKAIYFYNLLMSLISYRNTKCDIVIDGKSTTANIFSLNVGNGRYCGGGMRQTPFALPDDGILDVTIIKEMGKFEIVRNLKILYNGTILNHPKVEGYKCKNVKVFSDSVLHVEADGESLGHSPADFSIIPAALNIVYGTKIIQ
jgi:YegS/Rv2252/BmrU family lipid kinase